ncbi:hypothetical protein ACO2Q0_03045 [Phenylobacterium sp. VNQ135]|uniref:hypothetical protein n=1 Tax=Phenylobacterium sp. VNQ135 TaxID=3400922 RepID=UPI003C0BDB63
MSAIAAGVLRLMGSDAALKAAIVMTLGLLAGLVQVLVTRPEQRSDNDAVWALEVNPHAAPALIMLLAGLIVAGAFTMERPWTTNPVFWYGMLLLAAAQCIWLLRLATLPLRRNRRALRLLAITLVAAPTAPYALVFLGGVQQYGAAGLMAWPVALPALIVLPFIVMAYGGALTGSDVKRNVDVRPAAKSK